MYLVDSSVWIDYLNNNTPQAVDTLISLENTGLMPLIYAEVLQGAKNQKVLDTYQFYLSAQKFYSLKDSKQSYQQAALIYLKCRQKGITVCSTIDCLIAQCTIENDITLLHNDKNFMNIASVISTLKQQYTGN